MMSHLTSVQALAEQPVYYIPDTSREQQVSKCNLPGGSHYLVSNHF